MKESCLKGCFCSKAGFTLIELLVVVLIIGILAAVAVPQYQKAVRKARYAKMLPALKSVVQAQETYFLSNNQYADEWNELDVEIPKQGTCSVDSSAIPQQACRLIDDVTCMCLGTRGNPASHTVMVAFAANTDIISTNPSGYEYVLEKVTINSGSSLDKGLYCRENNYSSSRRTDYHCADGAGHKSWYGSWFRME